MKKKLLLSPRAFNVVASLLLTSMLGITFAGYDLGRLRALYSLFTPPYACLTAENKVKDNDAANDEFDII